LKTMRMLVPLCRTFLLLITLAIMGCGSGGDSDSAPSQTKIVLSNGASISIVDSGNGTNVVQGENLQGVAGFDIRMSYDPAVMNPPTVAQGELVSGFMFAANTTTPGLIKAAIISTRAVSGTGPILMLAFLPGESTGSVALDRVIMIDASGHQLH